MSGEYIDRVIKNFQTISNLLYDDRNKELVIDLYLSHEVNKRNKMKLIKQFKEDIELETMKQKSLYNRPIEVLRNEGKLYKLLQNLTMDEVNWLRDKVDINPEFERLDRERFEEMKRNRGTSVGQSLTN